MKRTLIDRIPVTLPEEIGELCRDAKIYDSSSSAEAKVYFIDRGEGFYLKIAPSGSLKKEALMTEYFHKKKLGTKLLNYISNECDIMLSQAVRGEDCTHKTYLDDPKRLCDLLAERLRYLHEIDCSDCPIQDKISEYIALSEKNYATDNYNKEHFPDSFGYRCGEEAFSVLSQGKHLLKNEVLIHGDYCLPNIMLDRWRFSGFIDLDQSGVGDRHIDLFWGRWSLGFNLMLAGNPDPHKYDERFFDAYGRDKIDSETLKIVAAAEVFG